MTVIAFFVFVMVYSHLTYTAPTNVPKWQLPGIADAKFVFNMTVAMSAFFSFLLYTYKTLPAKK